MRCRFYELFAELVGEIRRQTLLLGEQVKILAEIRGELKPKIPITRSLSINFNPNLDSNGDLPMADLNLLVGQSSIGTINPLKADGTPSGGTLSNQTWTISDPGITVTDNADGTATFLGTAATQGDITGTASATVTDTNGVVSQLTKTFTVNVATVAPPPEAITTQLGVSFTPPQ